MKKDLVFIRDDKGKAEMMDNDLILEKVQMDMKNGMNMMKIIN